MSCLSDGVCAYVREELEGEARAFWDANEDALRELTRSELEGLVDAVSREATGVQACIRLSWEWRRADLESWRAWRNNTTDSLRGVARRRVEVRAKLLEALVRASGAVLQALAAALGARLGL